jgi:phage baseplate assembly protein W
MASKKFYSISYPFTNEMVENYYVDLDSNQYSMIKSDLIHFIFTQKGTKLRNPDFGTDLTKFIFNPNDNTTISSIKTSLQEDISKSFNNITITNLSITEDENNVNDININISYIITEGNIVTTDNINVTL